MSNQDWQSLQTLWQQQSVDLPRLRRRTRWKTLRMRINVALEWVALPALWGFAWYVWQYKDLSAWQLGWLLSWSALTPWLCWKSWKLRRGTWRANDDSLLALLHLQQRRAVAALKMARWSVRALLAGGVLTIVWLLLQWLFEPKLTADVHGMEGPVFTVFWMWLWALISHIYASARQREIERVQHLLAAIENGHE